MNEWLTEAGALYRSTYVSGVYAEPAEIDDALLCSEPTPASRGDRERAGIADLVSTLLVYTAINTTADNRPRRGDRLHLGGIDYLIAAALMWPTANPEFCEVFLTDEGVTAH